MEDEGQLERVERPESVRLPLRSCRLNMTTDTQKTDQWLVVKITLILSYPTCHMLLNVSEYLSPHTKPFNLE